MAFSQIGGRGARVGHDRPRLRGLCGARGPPFHTTLPYCLLTSLFLSSLEMSDTQVYEPEIRVLFRTASHFCEAVVLKLRTYCIPLHPTQCGHAADEEMSKGGRGARVGDDRPRLRGLCGSRGAAIPHHPSVLYTVAPYRRGTSLTRNSPLLGPYSRTQSRAVWWS